MSVDEEYYEDCEDFEAEDCEDVLDESLQSANDPIIKEDGNDDYSDSFDDEDLNEDLARDSEDEAHIYEDDGSEDNAFHDENMVLDDEEDARLGAHQQNGNAAADDSSVGKNISHPWNAADMTAGSSGHGISSDEYQVQSDNTLCDNALDSAMESQNKTGSLNSTLNSTLDSTTDSDFSNAATLNTTGSTAMSVSSDALGTLTHHSVATLSLGSGSDENLLDDPMYGSGEGEQSSCRSPSLQDEPSAGCSMVGASTTSTEKNDAPAEPDTTVVVAVAPESTTTSAATEFINAQSAANLPDQPAAGLSATRPAADLVRFLKARGIKTNRTESELRMPRCHENESAEEEQPGSAHIKMRVDRPQRHARATSMGMEPSLPPIGEEPVATRLSPSRSAVQASPSSETGSAEQGALHEDMHQTTAQDMQASIERWLELGQMVQQATSRDHVDMESMEEHPATVARMQQTVKRSSPGIRSGPSEMLGRGMQNSQLSGQDLEGIDWSGAILTGSDFSNAKLGGANLSGCDLRGVDFSNADMKYVSLQGAWMTDAKFDGACLDHANLEAAAMEHTSFTTQASLKHANLKDCKMFQANLESADLSNANLVNANLHQAQLRRAKLCSANLSGANLAGGRLFQADLRGATMKRVNLFHAYLEQSRMKDVDLRNAMFDLAVCCKRGWLCGSRIGTVDWSGKDLKASQLQGCHFENAKLSDIRWQQSDLRDVIFDNCDLRRASLDGSCLENAIVNGSDFKGAAGLDKAMMKETRTNFLTAAQNRKPIRLHETRLQNKCRPVSAVSHFTAVSVAQRAQRPTTPDPRRLLRRGSLRDSYVPCVSTWRDNPRSSTWATSNDAINQQIEGGWDEIFKKHRRRTKVEMWPLVGCE